MAKKIQKFNTSQHMTNNLFEVYWYKAYNDFYDDNIDLHHHDFFEIYFFMEGNVKYIIENRNYQLIPGDILLISPLELHQPRFTDEKNPYERIILWINKQFLEQFSTQFTNLTYCFDTTEKNHTNLLRLRPAIRQTLEPIIQKLLDEYNNDAYGHDISSISYLLQIMVELNRYALLPQKSYEEQDKSTLIITNILNYISEHYTEDLSLDFMAEKFFMNKYHLSHEFKRLIGTSFYRYIIQKRLIIAKQMLSNDIKPTDVYHKCGFGDYANFYRAFKFNYGMSPKEYISIVKNANIPTIL